MGLFEAVLSANAGLTQLGGGLQKGVDTLSLNQTVTFELYTRIVLPLDGYVFWVKVSALETSSSALLNASVLNSFTLNQPEVGAAPSVPTPTLIVKGSLHYSTEQVQEEDAVFSMNRVVFTSEAPVDDLNHVSPSQVYIAEHEGIRFAFNSREMYYRQANLWHYAGNAVYSVMDTQIIDDPRLFNTRALIVSNSLPAWLATARYAPAYPVLIPFPRVPLFPSFLIPGNLEPPFVSVHIDPEQTASLQSAPRLGPTLSHDQLTRDTVTLTCYGMNNDVVLRFMDAILQYSFDTDAFGIMNMPAPVDDKRTQSELTIIAQKKRLIFEVSYNQRSIRNIAQQMVESVAVTQSPMDQPPIPFQP